MDLTLNGVSFTWSNNQHPPSMARLDRLLIFEDWAEIYPHVCQSALPRPTSDHCPICLDSNFDRWGPAPFRFELSWLKEENFPNLVTQWWIEERVDGWAAYKLSIK